MSNNTTLTHLPTIAVSSSQNTTIHFRETYHIPTDFRDYWVEYINFVKRLCLSQIIVLIFIITFIILGNTLVLVATWKERILHQPNKYFIACLAVADLLVGIFVAPRLLYLSISFHKQQSNELNIRFCRFLVWMDTLSLTTSIYTLTFISFDRYLKISKPLQYKSRITTSRSLKIIVIIWLISSCFATYAAIPGSGSSGLLLVGAICNVGTSTSFYTFLSISAFFLPTIIILVTYALIFDVAHKRRKMLRNGELGQTNNDENQRNTFLKDLKVVRMLLIVVGVFVFCWGPYFIHLLLLYHNAKILSEESTGIISVIVIALALLNSVCNPIIYACLDQTYTKAFKHLFQRTICRPSSNRQQPTGALELRQVRSRQQNG